MLVAFISSKDDLVRWVTQDPLIETELSLQGIQEPIPKVAAYFGIGLSNGSPELTTGLPIDILSMLLTAERIAKRKHILVADSHALTNGFTALSVDQIAREEQEVLQRTIENFKLENWSVVLASRIDCSPEYTTGLSTTVGEHEYVRKELADMRWFHEEKGVDLKIGWALKGNKNSDEVSFDQKFREQFGERLSFIYVVPGRTFNPKKLRAAPYFCGDPEARILIRRGEDVAGKIAAAKERFGSEATKPYENFLNLVVRAYDKTIEQTQRGPLYQRLQEVIDRCTR